MDQQCGVQGFLTLNYNAHGVSNILESSASQLSAGDHDTVVLTEYNQKKTVSNETYKDKSIEEYKISAGELKTLIKEYGMKI